MKKIILTRVVVSILLTIVFFVVIFTAIGLYLSPAGRIAKETSWKFLGFDKWQLEKAHTIFGFIMVGLIIIHLSINHKMFLGELKLTIKR